MWVMFFYVIVWTLWNIRNKVIFEEHKPDWELEAWQVKMRWGFWLKAWAMNKNIMIDELVTNPSALRKWRYLSNGR